MPKKIEAKITKKTKAILVVHIFGQAAEMAPILALAGGPGVILVLFALLGSAETRGSTTALTGMVGVVALVGFGLELLALALGVWALRSAESNPRGGGRSLAITGMVAAAVCSILLAEVAILVLRAAG